MTSTEQQSDSPALEPVATTRWRAVLLAAVAACAACGIIYELALLTLSTSLNGGGIVATSLIVAGYIAALGAGALLVKPLLNWAAIAFVAVEALLGIVGGLSAAALYVMFSFVGGSLLTLALGTALIGALVGAEVPLLMTLLQRGRTAGRHRYRPDVGQPHRCRLPGRAGRRAGVAVRAAAPPGNDPRGCGHRNHQPARRGHRLGFPAAAGGQRTATDRGTVRAGPRAGAACHLAAARTGYRNDQPPTALRRPDHRFSAIRLSGDRGHPSRQRHAAVPRWWSAVLHPRRIPLYRKPRLSRTGRRSTLGAGARRRRRAGST